MTTKSSRNIPIDDEPEYTFGKSIDSASPKEWDTVAAKLYHPSDAPQESWPVENPDHYNTGAIEAIEAIRASMPPEQFFGYLKGNVMKYLWRYDYKEKPVEDLRKADWYLNRLIDVLIEDKQWTDTRRSKQYTTQYSSCF